MYALQFFNLLVTLAAASTVAAECHDEEPTLYCYNGPDDNPQDLTVSDVTYIANALRAYGREIEGGRYFTMTAKDAPNCAEWTLFTQGSAVALAKHVGSRKDSSVLFEDIANTIDGGQHRHEVGPALIQCLADGGSASVIFNGSDVAYKTGEYLEKGYTPEGILIKIVTTNPDEL
ncbi:hypothetical protein B0J13DRAFT_562642 [Dactylonectria estremocensis]|uniref:Ecp2 effector protein domain-containing protein n=1 Tax=Dactylonectria estremocensis TaxID=1079267 RepID=A0A9P9E329_9HYPO|nr:hypothetical protein B0J13DRAFT_562642 [Dactylonectria estremocensis]